MRSWGGGRQVEIEHEDHERPRLPLLAGAACHPPLASTNAARAPAGGRGPSDPAVINNYRYLTGTGTGGIYHFFGSFPEWYGTRKSGMVFLIFGSTSSVR